MKIPAPLTDAQRAVYLEFVRRADANQPPPSHRDLMAKYGWRSPAAARKHIAALVRKGMLKLEPGKSRGAHLPGPLVGAVPHIEGMRRDGMPIKVLQQIPLPTQLHPGDPAYLFNAVNSVRSRGIEAGDLVLARRGSRPTEGDLVVVVEKGMPRVMSAQGARASSRRIVAVVVWTLRNHGFTEDEAKPDKLIGMVVV